MYFNYVSGHYNREDISRKFLIFIKYKNIRFLLIFINNVEKYTIRAKNDNKKVNIKIFF